MKRAVIILFALMFLAVSLSAKDKFMISLNGNMMFPNDGNFKDVYGSTVIYPGLQVGYDVFKNVYLFLGYDVISKKGTTPVLEQEAASLQHFISLGAGYQGEISEKIGYQVELGIFNVSYQEESLGEKVSDSAIGFLIDGALLFKLGKRFFGMIGLGYFIASDTVDEVDIKLGGVKTGIGLGVRF